VLAGNRAWLEGRPRDAGELFHPDAVAVFSGANQRLQGRDAIVQSYADYCANVKTHAFEEREHTVDVFGDTAVVRYRFFVRYEAQGAVHDEVGQEVLVFVRRDDRWRVVWRTQTPVDP
jgi:uncharacterized protein (TIGR02246 family)